MKMFGGFLKFSKDETGQMCWIFEIVSSQKCVSWNKCMHSVVAWHFLISMLAVRPHIATGPLSRNDGPLRHMWAGTYGHSVGHRALRCTTPSTASGALLHHFGHGAVQVSSTALRHHRTAQVRGTPFFHVYCCSPYSVGRAHAGFRPPAWALPGSPFVLVYLVYASSASTTSGAVRRTLGGD